MRRLVGVLLLVFSAGCVTITDVVREKDEGTSRVYAVTADQAWEIAKAVFRWEGATNLSEHRAERYMLASDTNDPRTGTVMAAWVEPDPDGRMRVTVVTRNRMLLNPAKLLTEEDFHQRFAQAVQMVKDGKPLPAKPPN